ncbi:hypothetical protein GCM10010378_57180 [Streptomyces viridochromogenes]
MEENDEVHDVMKRVMDEKHRRTAKPAGPECGGGRPDKAQALARDLCVCGTRTPPS